MDKETNGKLGDFFRLFDENSFAHHRKEEKSLFPLLEKRLIEKGEHSPGPEQKTAVSLMEQDHLVAAQRAATAFSLFGLSSRLDRDSRLIVLDLALKQGKSLVELMRLHIYREDFILFPLAHQSIQKNEFEEMDMLKVR